MADDLSKLLKALQNQGFQVRRTTKGHYQVHQDGQYVTTIGGTASDWRALRNAVAAARRHGLIWPPPR